METIALEHVPGDHGVHVAVFKDIQNAAFLHSQLLAHNADFEFAFVDASLVFSRVQILAAAYKALTAKLTGKLKTPNVHSELVASLSSSHNISEAYRRFGIGSSTRDVIIVKITFPTDANPQPPSPDDIYKHLQTHVQGVPAAFTDAALAESTDWARVRKYYKLNGLAWLDALPTDGDRKEQMGVLALGAMALQGL